jgi:uncharacterized protein
MTQDKKRWRLVTGLQIKRMENVLAIRTPSGRVVGFHSNNLEVARLSNESWSALTGADEQEAISQLKEWNEQKLEKKEKQKNQIRSITINVTQVCNLHCTYCAAGGDGSFGDPVKKISVEKTLPQIRFFLEKLPTGSEFRITFLGGEPLLYPEGIELIGDYARELARQKDIALTFVVVTNGTQFNEKSIAILKKLKAQITISLDGPAVINDLNRPTKGGKGTTLTVEKGIGELLQHRTSLGKIGVSGVFGAMNEDLPRAYEYYRQLDVDWMDFTYDHTEVRSEVSRRFTDGLSKVAAIAFKAGGEKALRQIKLFDTYFELLDSQVGTENFCGAGKTYLIVDARNNLYTCPWVVGDKNEIVGNGETLFDDKLKPYQDPLIEKNGCQNCWARYICGGGCMYMHKNKTGDKHQVDENFCERTRSLIALAILYYEESRSTGNQHLSAQQ